MRSFFLFLLCHSFFLLPILGEDKNELDGVKITEQFYYKIDTKKILEFPEIQNQAEFTPIQETFVNFGFVTGNLWLKLPDSKSFPNLDSYLLFINAQNIDSIQIFYQTKSDEWKEDRSGHIFPMSQRYLPHRNFILDLKEIKYGSPIYIKVNSDISIQFSIRLIQEKTLHTEDYTKQWIYGLFFGSLCLIFLYNIAVSFFVRDINYFYYLGYVLTFGFGQLSLLGFWSYFFVPESFYLKRIGIPFFFSLCLYFFIRFSTHFLRIKKRFPKIHRISTVLSWIALGNTILAVFGGIRTASIGVTWITLLVCSYLLVVLVSGLRKKIRSYYYFFWAFAFLLLSGVLYAILKMGVLPTSEFFEEMLFPFASLGDLVIFSFALADRIQILRQEKDKAIAQIANLHKERTISRDILMQSLPKQIPKVEGLNIQIFILPMKDVGGDFYEYYSPNSNEIGLLLCDVSGHGIPASLISAMGKVAFTTQKENLFSPKRVLEGMNRVLFGNCSPQYLTASYVYLNTSATVWRFGRAGHPSSYLQRKSGEIIKIHPKGRIVGAFPEIQIEEESYQVLAGDRVLLLSDGVLESFDPYGQMYGEGRLIEFLRTYRDLPSSLFKTKLIQDLESFCKREIKEWDDDITFIFLELI